MAQQPTCKWTGHTRRSYVYHIYPIGTNFKAEPGNYIFAKEASAGKWAAVYVGQTGDLRERFDSHHKMPAIEKNGATHIHARINKGGKQARLFEESDLVANYRPPCND